MLDIGVQVRIEGRECRYDHERLPLAQVPIDLPVRIRGDVEC